MKYLLFLLFAFSVSQAAAQAVPDQVRTHEFLGSSDRAGRYYSERAQKMCFNFGSGTANGGRDSDLCYGTLRAGEEWDWFSSTGDGTRNRLVEIGRKEWRESFVVPFIAPWPELRPGERRNVRIDGSGNDGKPGKPGEKGRDGTPGMNGDGTYADRVDDRATSEQPSISGAVESPVPGALKPPKPGEYFPYVKAQVGRMYAMHVVDSTRDFYVVFRVEEIDRGMRCKITWKKVPPPVKA